MEAFPSFHVCDDGAVSHRTSAAWIEPLRNRADEQEDRTIVACAAGVFVCAWSWDICRMLHQALFKIALLKVELDRDEYRNV